MVFLKIGVALFFFFCLFYWLMQLIMIIRVIKSVPKVENFPDRGLNIWPKVSVIAPARNEARTIADAIQSRLRDDYPNLEIILIDDRSNDGTTEIIDQLSQRDKRIKALHIKHLPEDWLGKVYAMDQGVRVSSGEWLLFSDADVYIKTGTLKKCVIYATERNLDHLAVFPDLYSVGFILDILLTIFIKSICLVARVWAIEDPKSSASVGSGAFNLVRRSALDKTKGLEWIKLEMGDDVALGQMLKQSGARESLVNGRGFVGVYFYRSLKEAALGTDRPTFTTIGEFSFWRLFFMGLILMVLELSPYLALLPLGIPYLRFLGLFILVLSITILVLANIWMKRPVWSAFFAPLGIVVSVFLMWRAGFLGAIRGGVYWRGTFYPTEILKQGRRVKI